MRFWGLEANLGRFVCATGSGRGGAMKGATPPVDTQRAIARASARDLGMCNEWDELYWELDRITKTKMRQTQNTARDRICLVRCRFDIDRSYNNVIWDDA